MSLIGLGGVYLQLGRYDEAIEYHTQALSATRQAGHGYGEMLALHSLAESQYLAGRTQDAHRTFRDALAIFDDLDDPRAEQIRERLRVIETTQIDEDRP